MPMSEWQKTYLIISISVIKGVAMKDTRRYHLYGAPKCEKPPISKCIFTLIHYGEKS